MSNSVQLPVFVNTNGDWGVICASLYQHFESCFKRSPPRQIRGKLLVFDTRKINSTMEEGFWHVVTIGTGEDRLLDPDRARRVCWIAPILDGTAPGLSKWAYQEGNGVTKLYFWLESEHYVVILAEKTRVVSLVTAFYVNKTWLEKDLVKRRATGTTF